MLWSEPLHWLVKILYTDNIVILCVFRAEYNVDRVTTEWEYHVMASVRVVGSFVRKATFYCLLNSRTRVIIHLSCWTRHLLITNWLSHAHIRIYYATSCSQLYLWHTPGRFSICSHTQIRNHKFLDSTGTQHAIHARESARHVWVRTKVYQSSRMTNGKLIDRISRWSSCDVVSECV